MKSNAIAVLATIITITFATAFCIQESKSNFYTFPNVQKSLESANIKIHLANQISISENSGGLEVSSSNPTDLATNPSSNDKIDPYYGIISFVAITLSFGATITIFVFIKKTLKK